MDVSFDIARLHAAYRAGLTPQEMIEACLRRIAGAGDPGIFLHVADRESLLRQAEALGSFDAPGRPLWGLPFAVKDNIDVGGMPTTAACPAFAYVAREDAFCVARLRAAGAIVIGKTNLDQFAAGLVGLRTPFPPPRNAIDPDIVPGGSSSGSAVAVARGLVSFALGTDTAGSGRVPAALNNVVGLKPSLGAVSTRGVVPACRTLDAVSVFALTVDDAHAVFMAATGYDAAEPYSRQLAVRRPASLPPNLRVGVPSASSLRFYGDEVQSVAFAAAEDTLRGLGAATVALDFSVFHEVAQMLYDGPWLAERYAAVETLIRDRPEALHPVTRGIIARAEGLSALDAFRGFYRLRDLARRAEALMDRIDLLCVPSVPTMYSVADVMASPVETNARLGTYTNFVNLLGLCGVTVPVAARGDGRPGSVTILARDGQDDRAAALASALQRRAGAALGATGHRLPAEAPRLLQPAADEMAIAVAGAHMSGLPLNRELVALGGRFLRQAKTAPHYRLHALAGGPPARPGLVRDSHGGAIELEIWTLPVAAAGCFLQGIPAPLGLGTVELEDGARVTGFICEAAGLVGAEDITAYGGWRAWLARGHVPAPA